MNISLTPDLERYVDQKVVSGAFPSASEVVCAGLRLLEDEERLRQQRVAQIRQKVGEALEQLDRGEGIPSEQVYEELRQESQRLRHAAHE